MFGTTKGCVCMLHIFISIFISPPLSPTTVHPNHQHSQMHNIPNFPTSKSPQHPPPTQSNSKSNSKQFSCAAKPSGSQLVSPRCPGGDHLVGGQRASQSTNVAQSADCPRDRRRRRLFQWRGRDSGAANGEGGGCCRCGKGR